MMLPRPQARWALRAVAAAAARASNVRVGLRRAAPVAGVAGPAAAHLPGAAQRVGEGGRRHAVGARDVQVPHGRRGHDDPAERGDGPGDHDRGLRPRDHPEGAARRAPDAHQERRAAARRGRAALRAAGRPRGARRRGDDLRQEEPGEGPGHRVARARRPLQVARSRVPDALDRAGGDDFFSGRPRGRRRGCEARGRHATDRLVVRAGARGRGLRAPRAPRRDGARPAGPWAATSART